MRVSACVDNALPLEIKILDLIPLSFPLNYALRVSDGVTSIHFVQLNDLTMENLSVDPFTHPFL